MLSIVIPTLNEEENISRLIPSLIKELKEYKLEIVVVDGNSTDKTQEVVKKYSKKYKFIRLVTQSRKGFANAVKTGIKEAKGGIIVTMDAENHMPSEIHVLLSQLKKCDYDVVIGSRFLPGADVDLERKRMLSSKIANKIAKVAMKLNVRDCSSGFRAYKAKPAKKAIRGLKTKYFSVQVELLEKISEAGGKLGEVPVHYLGRESGESKFNFKSAVSDATTLLKIARDREIDGLKSRSRKLSSDVRASPGKIKSGLGKMKKKSNKIKDKMPKLKRNKKI